MAFKLTNILNVLTFLFLLSGISQAYAQSINTVRDINFGEAVILDNSSQHSIQVNANGSYSIDPEFGVISNPQAGEYLAVGLPASTPIINVTVTVDQQLNGAGEDFIIDNFDIDAPAFTDPSGQLPILLGARLTTTGSGLNYTPEATFSSIMTITVNY